MLFYGKHRDTHTIDTIRVREVRQAVVLTLLSMQNKIVIILH